MPKEKHDSKATRQKLERGQVGIAGEYAVLTELIIHGFAAARTDGNSKDIDILCSHISTGQVANMQVKTLNPNTDYSKKNKVCFKFRIANRKSNNDMLEDKIKTIEEKQIYYVFCALKNPDIPSREKDRFFIATPEQITAQIRERVKKKTSVIDFQLFEKPEDTRIPEGGFGLIEDYEDKWVRLGNHGLDISENEVNSNLTASYLLEQESKRNAAIAKKIKLEHIQFAAITKYDLSRELPKDEQFMTLRLNTDNLPSIFWIQGCDNYKKFEDMIKKSGGFEYEKDSSKLIEQCVYRRKRVN